MAAAVLDNSSAKVALAVPAGQVVLGAAVEEECSEGSEDWAVKP